MRPGQRGKLEEGEDRVRLVVAERSPSRLDRAVGADRLRARDDHLGVVAVDAIRGRRDDRASEVDERDADAVTVDRLHHAHVIGIELPVGDPRVVHAVRRLPERVDDRRVALVVTEFGPERPGRTEHEQRVVARRDARRDDLLCPDPGLLGEQRDEALVGDLLSPSEPER